ncbi:MAG: methylase, partial [Proteobacteria bacterium]|nr:methylase [Pseudomonadota bacterium]
MDMAFKNFNGNYGKLDYVACWYAKTIEYINDKTECAYVSTNSIVQGESVATMWKPLFDKGLNITFAWQPFVWNSQSNDKAHVHCVIVGFNNKHNIKLKTLYQNEIIYNEVDNINGYLLAAPNVFIQARCQILTPGIPTISKGSQPTDGGNFFFSEIQRNELLERYPSAKCLIKQFVGADEFINNKKRYCLWLKGINPSIYRNINPIIERLEAIAEIRRKSPTASVQRDAKTPMLFTQIRQPEDNYIIVPRHSSENRDYIPMGFMSPDIICGDANMMIPNANIYLFGVLVSNVHMAWMKIVCGRLEMRYRYSPSVYNNFPWPTPTEAQKAKNEKTAQAILDARALYPDSSLADLYDEVTMPPELRKAHKANDNAVMDAYGFKHDMTESEIVAELFKLYQKLVEAEQNQGEAKPKRTRKKS